MATGVITWVQNTCLLLHYIQEKVRKKGQTPTFKPVLARSKRLTLIRKQIDLVSLRSASDVSRFGPPVHDIISCPRSTAQSDKRQPTYFILRLYVWCGSRVGRADPLIILLNCDVFKR